MYIVVNTNFSGVWFSLCFHLPRSGLFFGFRFAYCQACGQRCACAGRRGRSPWSLLALPRPPLSMLFSASGHGDREADWLACELRAQSDGHRGTRLSYPTALSGLVCHQLGCFWPVRSASCFPLLGRFLDPGHPSACASPNLQATGGLVQTRNNAWSNSETWA